jgi:hypothetical protein
MTTAFTGRLQLTGKKHSFTLLKGYLGCFCLTSAVKWLCFAKYLYKHPALLINCNLFLSPVVI